jgi:hypothetical protein
MDSNPIDSEQPTIPLRQCVNCGTLVDGPTPVCIPCRNNHLLFLRLAVKAGRLGDFETINHRYVLTNAQWSDMRKNCGAYVGYTTMIHLLMAHAQQRDPEFWLVEEEQ